MMLKRTTQPELEYGNELVERFGANDGGSRLLGKGWGVPEGDFVWSEGKFAELLVPVSWRRARISIGIWGFVPQGQPPQDVLMFVNGRLQEFRSVSERVLVSTEVELDQISTKLAVSFYLPNARRPSDYGPTDDSRVLALALSTLMLEYD